MSPLNDMGLFAAIVQHGSFTAAARALGVPLSTLSRRLIGLETRLDVRLLQRTTRSQKLTEAGRIYLQHCKSIMMQAQEAEHALQRLKSEPSGNIRYVMPFAVDASWASAVISAFLEKYPKITLEGMVHLKEQGAADIEADVLLDYGERPVTHHQVIALGEMGLHLYASPAYLFRAGTPTEPEQLREHALIKLTPLPWPQFAPPSLRAIDPIYRISTNEALVARQICIDGLGLAWLPELFTLQMMQDGSLVRVMPQHNYTMQLWLTIKGPGTVKVNLFVEHLQAMVGLSAPWMPR